MKRKNAAILCTALCAALLLAGCGAKEEQQAAQSYEETEKTETQQEEPAGQKQAQEPEAEEPETQEEIPEEDADSEAEDSPFLFEIENPVIFDSEGITVVVDERSLENDQISLTCSITNNNPDNKKVTFSFGFYIDNFSPFIDNSYKGTNNPFEVRDLAVGESTTVEGKIDLLEYNQFREMIGTESLPIESLSFYYEVQIGSDGETVSGHTVFKNPEFAEGNFSNIYGDKIGEFEWDKHGESGIIQGITSYELYLKHTENDYTLLTVKRVDNENSITNDLFRTEIFINDKSIDGSYLMGIGGFSFSDSLACSVYDTSNIRKDYEIANDVPLEGYIEVTDYFRLEKITTIPVTLE